MAGSKDKTKQNEIKQKLTNVQTLPSPKEKKGSITQVNDRSRESVVKERSLVSHFRDLNPSFAL